MSKMKFDFVDASELTLERAAKLGMVGAAGSGKTYSALQLATELLDGPDDWIAMIDTEHRTSLLYRKQFRFRPVFLTSFHPQNYIDAIQAAQDAGARVIVVDSLSPAWAGKDGALELKDEAASRSRSGNSFNAWREITPLHNRLVESLLACRSHLVVTLRTKVEYVIEEVVENGKRKQVPRKVGMQPIQREGMDYELDVVFDLEQDTNKLIVGKSRCDELTGRSFLKDASTPGKIIKKWLADVAVMPPTPAQEASTKEAPAVAQSLPEKPAAANVVAVQPRSEEEEAALKKKLETALAKLAATATLAECIAVKDEQKALLRGTSLMQFQQAYRAKYKAIEDAARVAS